MRRINGKGISDIEVTVRLLTQPHSRTKLQTHTLGPFHSLAIATCQEPRYLPILKYHISAHENSRVYRKDSSPHRISMFQTKRKSLIWTHHVSMHPLEYCTGRKKLLPEECFCGGPSDCSNPGDLWEMCESPPY